MAFSFMLSQTAKLELNEKVICIFNGDLVLRGYGMPSEKLFRKMVHCLNDYQLSFRLLTTILMTLQSILDQFLLYT